MIIIYVIYMYMCALFVRYIYYKDIYHLLTYVRYMSVCVYVCECIHI